MNYEYQSHEGAGCVNAWFEGYPAGAMAAKSRDLDKYSNVYISRLMDAAIQQDKAEVKLPSDVKVVGPSEVEPNRQPANNSPFPIYNANSYPNYPFQYR